MPESETTTDPMAQGERPRTTAALDTAQGMVRGYVEAAADIADAVRELNGHHQDLFDRMPRLTHGLPPHQAAELTASISRQSRLITALTLRAHGYTQGRPSDMYYPRVHDELAEHGWQEQPNSIAAGGVSAAPEHSGAHTRGWPRVFTRGLHVLHLRFTGPRQLAHASLTHRGRLHETSELRAAVTTPDSDSPLTTPMTYGLPPEQGIDAGWDEIEQLLTDTGWTRNSSQFCDTRGNPDPGAGPDRVDEWIKPEAGGHAPGRIRLFGSTERRRPHVWYWAGTVCSRAHLERIARR